MYIIAGLGNPGSKYAGSRHNMGFDVIDRLSRMMNIPLTTEKYNAMLGSGFYEGEKVVLVKPLTYMNLSGQALQPLCAFYKVEPSESLIVISDDIDLKPGRLRIRKKGSAGGHNGLKNIIQLLGSEEFIRIRVGVGAKDKNRDLVDHVLGRPQGEDGERIDEALDGAAEACVLAVKSGIDIAMNEYNKFRCKAEQAEEEEKRRLKEEARRKAQAEREARRLQAEKEAKAEESVLPTSSATEIVHPVSEMPAENQAQ